MSKTLRLLASLAILGTAVGAGCGAVQQTTTNSSTTGTTNTNSTTTPKSNNSAVRAAQESLDEFNNASAGVDDAMNQNTSAVDSATTSLSNE